MFDVLLLFVPKIVAIYALLGLFGITSYFFLDHYKKTQWILYALLVWLPLESVVLMHAPPEYYTYIKYVPEMILYGYFFATWMRFIQKTGTLIPRTPLTPWICGSIVLASITLLIQWYSPVTWLFGMRQIMRFVVIFFILWFGAYTEQHIRRIVALCFGMLLFETGAGLVQYLAGGRLDAYLFSSAGVQVSSWATLGAIEQFWTAGTRIFGTLGRYDRLGSFLAFGLTYLFACVYYIRSKTQQYWFWALFATIAAALLLTYSRASWIAAAVGIGVIGVGVYADRRLKKVMVVGASIFFLYIGAVLFFTQSAQHIVESPTMSLSERVLEATSIRAWRESYDGAGRIFFIINTPRIVIPHAPLFGVGPGRYGGGVASALDNREVYEKLHLPFGVQNVYGQIDNNWLSIWGELGTLGLIVYAGMFVALIRMSYALLKMHTVDQFPKILAAGCVGSVAAIAVLGCFGPYAEFRTLMCYFWTGAGIVGYYYQKYNAEI